MQEGDSITIDADARLLQLNVPDEELARRRAAYWRVLAKYARLVSSASLGAVTDSEVTREAATMVLTDDNFATNGGVILTVLGTQLLGLPTPFTAIQILCVDQHHHGRATRLNAWLARVIASDRVRYRLELQARS